MTLVSIGEIDRFWRGRVSVIMAETFRDHQRGLSAITSGDFPRSWRKALRSDKVTFNVSKLVKRGSPSVKKGRHRRFEEARKLKQSGPEAFDFGFGTRDREDSESEEDQYAAIAEKYGVVFDDEDDDSDD